MKRAEKGRQDSVILKSDLKDLAAVDTPSLCSKKGLEKIKLPLCLAHPCSSLVGVSVLSGVRSLVRAREEQEEPGLVGGCSATNGVA